MKRLRALIVDDERPARRWLRDVLLAHPQIQIVGEADGVDTALIQVEALRPDVLFLDVQMPPGSGFDLLPHLNVRVKVVFVTAYETFAVKAFEANALDYLLKPVHPERLAETVRRLLAASDPTDSSDNNVTAALASSQDQAALTMKDYVPLRDGGLLRIVGVAYIAAVEAEGAYSRITIREQEAMLVLSLIGDWERRLPNPPFNRLDRSHIVNLYDVTKVRTITRDRTEVNLCGIPDPLILGRAASRRLRKLLP